MYGLGAAVCHRDGGSRYASYSHGCLLGKSGSQASMGAKASCYSNAVKEFHYGRYESSSIQNECSTKNLRR